MTDKIYKPELVESELTLRKIEEAVRRLSIEEGNWIEYDERGNDEAIL